MSIVAEPWPNRIMNLQRRESMAKGVDHVTKILRKIGIFGGFEKSILFLPSRIVL